MVNRACGLSLLAVLACSVGCSKTSPPDEVAVAPASAPEAAPAPNSETALPNAETTPPAAADASLTPASTLEGGAAAEPAPAALPEGTPSIGTEGTNPAEPPPAAEPESTPPAEGSKPAAEGEKPAEPPAAEPAPAPVAAEAAAGLQGLGTAPSGAGGAPKEGSPEGVLQQFVLDLAADNLDALTPVIGKKAAGMIKQIKEGSLSDADKATIKEVLAKVRLAGPPKMINGGILVVLETEEGAKIQFTLAKENGKVVINDMKLPKNMPKKKAADGEAGTGTKLKSLDN